MNKVKLSKYGTFLSGRSLPKEIISNEKVDPKQPIELDFSDIPAVNQSFLSQLFLDLALLGYVWTDIHFKNVTTDALSSRIEQQLDIVFDRPTSARSCN